MQNYFRCNYYYKFIKRVIIKLTELNDIHWRLLSSAYGNSHQKIAIISSEYISIISNIKLNLWKLSMLIYTYKNTTYELTEE